MYRKSLSALFLLISTFISFSQSSLERFINHPALKHASVGVSVVDMETGQVIVNENAEKSLTPASVLKLLTTATAVELLGDEYRYKTVVTLDGDDPSRILVMGSGDPTLGSESFGDNKYTFFADCAAALKKVLPADKQYSIYVVDNLFGYDGVSSEWTWGDMGNYYAAGAYGISLFDNTYRLFFNTMDRNSCPRILRTEPEMKGLTFQNSLSLNFSGRDNAYIYGAPFSNERAVRGDIPGGRREFSIKGDIPDPGLLLGQTLAGYLGRAGIKVGKVETARNDYFSESCSPMKRSVPYRPGKPIFVHTSRPLKDIIREVNVKSNNHYAEHLIRTIGRHSRTDIYVDPLTAGIDFVLDYWSKKGVEVSSLHMHDGCGLAPQNAVSPKLLTDLLVYMKRNSNHSSAFFASLPKAGQEGTVSNFLRSTPLNGKVFVKSGSIGGVQCYAGYLIDGDKKYAFALMVNKFNGTRAQVRSAMERFLLGISAK